MTEWLQLEVASGDHLIQCPSKAGTPRADCMESHPGLYWISPEKKTPQPLWVACSTALLPSIWRHFSSYSYGTSCVFCLSCHWAGVPWKESGPTWHLSLRYFWVFIIFTLHCLFFRLNKPNSLSLFFPERDATVPLITLSNNSLSFLEWGVQSWRQYLRCGLIRAE